MKQKKLFQGLGAFAAILVLAALSCSGVADVSNLFATDTPTPTSTFTPSPTMTPSPTSTPTLTPSPSPTPVPSGATTEEQADGTTLFADYDNSYRLILPKDWTVLPFSTDDMADILQSMSDKNPEFRQMAENFKNLDPEVIRVMALNLNPKYMDGGASPSLSVIAIDNKVMTSMPLDFVLGSLEESFKQQGGEVISPSSTLTNANGVEMGSFEYVQDIPSPLGGKIAVHYKAIIFRAGDKMIMVELGTPTQYEDEFLPIMDQIADSVELLGQ
jgi:hypothetical protein